MTTETQAPGDGAGRVPASTDRPNEKVPGMKTPMTPDLEKMREVASNLRDAIKNPGHCGEGAYEQRLRAIEFLEAERDFDVTFTPENVLSLLARVEQLQGERDEALKEADHQSKCAQSWFDKFQAVEAQLATLQAEKARLEEAWVWLAAHHDLELSFGYPDEEEPRWEVHRVSGNYNDREWEEVAVGDTPLEAIQNAMLVAALKKEG